MQRAKRSAQTGGTVIRVLVAAGSVVVQAGLETVLASHSELTVLGSSSGITTLAQQVEALQPDVVLLELELEDESLAALSALDSRPPGITIVVLADNLQLEWAIEVLRSGVRAVLPREATANEIVAAVEAAAAGLVVLHPDTVDALLLEPAIPRVLPTSPTQALTPREIEVLGMLAEGLGNKTIARRLGISEHTVKFHVGSIFSKLNASSRTEAVALGARQGLVMF